MPEAFIIDAVRTPVTRVKGGGEVGGGLAGVHPAAGRLEGRGTRIRPVWRAFMLTRSATARTGTARVAAPIRSR